MFHDLHDWMLGLQFLGVREVDFSITRKTKKTALAVCFMERPAR